MPRSPRKSQPPSPQIYGLVAATQQSNLISRLVLAAGIDEMVLAGMAGVRTDRLAAILRPGDTSIRVKEMWALSYALCPEVDLILGLVGAPATKT